MKEWVLTIYDYDENPRHIVLDHLYEEETDAVSEAEDIADVEFGEWDTYWTLSEREYVTCGYCNHEYPTDNLAEMTVFEDHGKCWSCQRETLNQ